MPRSNVINFYRIKEEIDTLIYNLTEIQEDISNQIPETLQDKLNNMVDGYNKLLELDRQLILEWDFCDDLEKQTLHLFFDEDATSQ